MDATRREALVGAAATAAMMGAAGRAGAAPNLGSPVKTLFWTATITPCDKSLKFDPGAFRDILAWYKHCGADGVVVLGTSGEFPSFSVAERRQIAETALKDKNGLNVIIGPGTSNIAETIELAKHAEDHGADGLLVIPPFYYNDPATEGLTRYYSMLFDKVRVPINLYHIPGTSEAPISLELLKSLSHYPNLAGIKDSSGKVEGYRAFVEAFPDLNMRTGTNNNLEQAFDHGMGAILADGNVFTKLCADVFTAWRAKQDYKPALEKLRNVQRDMRGMGINSYGPMKYALSLQMGGPQTYQRPPHLDVTPEQKAAIKSALDKIKDMA
ncbi:dihydrodipicolinate synthase family protein [Phenylobacterium sp.]|uniref:dihydrodipicolinate synthase family protein n=1 Tax=Phenylobacterium sp. TaxID=1871053 RepID=UPI003BA9EC66